MEENRELRNEFTFIWSINLQQKRQEYTMEKSSLFILSGVGEIRISVCKRIKLDYFLILKKILKIDLRLKCKV